MKNRINLMAAAIVLVAVSCSKKDNAGSQTGIALSIKGTTTLPTVKKSLSAEGFSFSEALLGIREIEIKREEEHLNDGDMNFDFDGNYVVDLLTGTTTPSFGLQDFTPGTYNKFESKTAPLLPGGNSVSVKGTYTDNGGTAYNFEFATSSEVEFEFESDSSFVLTEGAVFDMLVNVNLPLLFDGVDFSKAATNDGGTVIINDTTNTDLTELIKGNIDHSAEMENENESEHESEHD